MALESSLNKGPLIQVLACVAEAQGYCKASEMQIPQVKIVDRCLESIGSGGVSGDLSAYRTTLYNTYTLIRMPTGSSYRTFIDAGRGFGGKIGFDLCGPNSPESRKSEKVVILAPRPKTGMNFSPIRVDENGIYEWIEANAATLQQVALGISASALAIAGVLMLFTPSAPAGVAVLGLSAKMVGAN